MPKVYEYNGIEFYIYPKDHPPAHIHIIKSGDYRIKMEIETGKYTIIDSEKEISQRTINELKIVVTLNQKKFITIWKIYAEHNRSK